ncbi:hypothetical protein [Streptomyces lutosisoli]|uniref:Tox-REase-7 domain-containing protein n=1 Tax=Streptomyces lutosisoli TaxID=2665721 RepID=A0ABW2VP93_9ACTN
MIEPENIPQFTGDLGQLDHHITALRGEADGIRQAGGAAHTQFQRLSAFYQAPEAEDLFASTVPVRDRADGFGDKLATVADALATYATEVAPIAARLKHLQSEAATFVAGLKTSSGAFDENWAHDQDKFDQHRTLMNEVAEAQDAFTAAEIAANNKITALVGGTQYMMVGAGKALFIPRGVELYGYTADALEQMEKLPWGTPVSKSHNWWDPDDLGYYAKSFVWDGLIVDNVWGTVDGLATLAGVHGGDAAGNAWEGLVRGIVGGETYLMESGGQKPTGFLAGDFAQDSKVYAKEFGKSFVAWDMWKENPARAAATVVFNALTLGAGPLKVASAGRVGTAAKVASVTAKIGDAIDPINAAAKVTARGIPKLAEVTANLRGVNDIPDLRAPHSVLELSDGSKVRIENGEFIRVDDAGRAISDTPRKEAAAETQATQEGTPAHQRQPAVVGAGGRASESAAAVGQNVPPHASHDAAPGGGGSDTPRGTGEVSHGAGRDPHGPGHGSSARHDHPDGTGPASATGATGDARSGTSAGGDGHATGSSGDHGSASGRELTPAERRKIDLEQARKANTDTAWRKEHYDAIGRRLSLDPHNPRSFDENGHELVKLAEGKNGELVPADDLPAAPGEKYRLDPVPLSERSVRPENINDLNRLAADRRNSMNLTSAEKDFTRDPSLEHAHALKEAQDAFGVDRPNNSKIGEKLGEAAARLHVMPHEFPDATRIEDLPQTGNGARQFDDLYRRKNGNLIIVEEKAPNADLEQRQGAGGAKGFTVKQGTPEYIETIVSEMEKRGPRDKQLAAEIRRAMRRKTLEYVMVKANENPGTYAGAVLKHFKIF